MPDKYGFKVTYRIKKEDKAEYERIKSFITQDLGSDICFIQWSLLRAFFNGMSQSPNPKDVTELKFLRQNIQLNIGCTINYNRLKARRLPPTEPKLELDKNRFFPLLLEEWQTMSEKNKAFWLERLKETGILPPPHFPLERKNRKTLKQILKKLWGIVQQLTAKWGLWHKR